MSDFQIKCNSDSRKKLVEESNEQGPINNDNIKTINGIDYIEVRRVTKPVIQKSNSDSDTETGLALTSSDKTNILLLLFLLKEPTPNTIEKENLLILGGTRIQNIGIKLAGRPDEILGDLNENEKQIINSLNNTKRKKLIVIKPTQEGDFSIYTLKLIEKGKPEETLTNFDPIFSQIDFSFKIDCILDFDCKFDTICPPVTFEEPLIDYMAKDYASFVKLILSRFSNIIPEWKEKSAADVTNVLIELLSYVGDHLSYYQDAVSTEAYLGTARKRISIRRHARLLDYFINEGSNARTWICFTVNATKNEELKGLILKKSTKVLTGEPTKDKKNSFKISISEDELQEIVSQPDTRIFETMHEINLYSFHNKMYFYTWGETDCCLPKGSTHATLLREIKQNNEGEEETEVSSLDIRIFSWETIVDNELDQNNLNKFMRRISSVFHDKDSIKIIQENTIDNTHKILKMVDNENQSKFISIELFEDEERALAKDNNDNLVYEFMAKKLGNNNDMEIYGLSLNAGDVLIFEEILSPTTLKSFDKDPSHRQAVKLREVKRKFDPINKANLVEIYWDKQDALRFPLCINKINSSNTTSDNGNGDPNDHIKIISVARGNVVLVDHGYTIKNEELEDAPKSGGIFYPKLDRLPITFASPFISYASAYSSIYYKQHIDDVIYPQILVTEGTASAVLNSNDDRNDENKDQEDENNNNNNNEIGHRINKWFPNRDLLSSDKFAREFVVEIDNDGSAYLRFGDGKNGQKPENRLDNGNNKNPIKFYASYRIGNGRIGNVRSETIKRIVEENKDNKNIVTKIQNIYNPLPAIGGADQESFNEVRQNAPVTFMRQERAVTEEDYTSVLRRHPEVQRALAMFRWTGSWYTVYVTIDRIGGQIVDESFKQEIYNFLNKFRLAGYDLEINSPNYVPLDVEINVCVKPNHYPEKVKKTLLNIFSTQVLEDGQVGLFHPDNFTFGQPLYLSKIYQTIMNVEGVESLFVNRFQRMGKSDNIELEQGVIEIHSSEIIRLDNDPNFPDNGKIDFVMRGGV